jgi:hypothetical protein
MVVPATPQGRRRLRQSDLPLLLVSFLVIPSLLFQWLRRGSDFDDSYVVLPTKSSADAVAAEVQPNMMNGIRPVSCAEIVEASQKNNTDANQNRLFLRYTKDEPQFWLSLHSPSYDNVRWSTMRFGRYYEKIQVRRKHNVCA